MDAGVPVICTMICANAALDGDVAVTLTSVPARLFAGTAVPATDDVEM